MKTMLESDTSKISIQVARLAIGGPVVALALLASLHLLSPKIDPSWHMISEFAYGRYGWVLSLMFISWALGSWALVYTIWSQLNTRAGKIGLLFLVAAGIGEAMASVFDINHQPLHDMAGNISVLSLPVAAVLISTRLARTKQWFAAKKALLWTANLTWISVVLYIATFILFVTTYIHAGGDTTASTKLKEFLPPGTIHIVGWTNRLFVVVFCVWAITVAWQAIKVHDRK